MSSNSAGKRLNRSATLKPIDNQKNARDRIKSGENVTNTKMNNYNLASKLSNPKPKDEFSGLPKLPQIGSAKSQKSKVDVDIEFGDFKVSFNDFELFYGRFSNLPKQKSSIVKIFLSSTFSDYKVERNILYSIAFPKIRAHCSNLDLEFQCVDMRWGVTEEISSQHTSEALCLQELINCKRSSLGPYFVGFIGSRYGSRSLPNRIEKNEFELLSQEIDSLNLDPNGFLKKWYKLDENNVPPNYVLLALSDGLGLETPIYKLDKPTAKIYQSKWKNESNELQFILQNGALSCFKKITEKEIKEAFNSNVNATTNILCYFREFNQDIPLAKDIKAEKFTDLIITPAGVLERDESAVEYLNALKTFIKAKNNQTPKYNVDWRDGGISPEKEPTHKDYITKFIENFSNDCIKAINSNYELQLNEEGFIKSTKNEAFNYSTSARAKVFGKISGLEINIEEIFKEVIHHSKFCGYKLKLFVEREDVSLKIKNYFKSTSRNKPLCIHASSGGGKTSLLAMLAKKFTTKWLNDVFTNCDPAIVIRFLGTSSKSNNLMDLIESICAQIQLIYDETQVTANQNQLLNQQEQRQNLINLFHNLLKTVSNKIRTASTAQSSNTKKFQLPIKKPLVIILDSIDQLIEQYNAFDLNWVPSTLPPNVFIIFSCISDYKGILENFKSKFKTSTTAPNPQTTDNSLNEFIIELPSLNSKFCNSMLNSYMSARHRTLTTKQTDYFIENSLKSQSPLYMKLILDQAVKWHSFELTNIFEQQNIADQESAILLLFKILEAKYGEEIVSYSLGYLTLSVNGLSDIEMDDLLSCNDVVLNAVYDYHDPPLSGTIRIPPLLWSRIKYEITEYLVEKQLSNKRIVSDWYHRKFREVAFEHYCVRLNRTIELSKHLADIYLHESGIQRTITLAKRNNLVIQDANRMITEQPLTYKNQRKLDVLAVYLINSQSYDSLNEACFCNLKYLLSKIYAFSLNNLLIDFQKYFASIKNENELQANQLYNHEQIKIIYKFLIFNEKPIRFDALAIVPLLIGQLNFKMFTKDEQENFTFLKQLLKQAHDFYETNSTSFKKEYSLKPLYPCLPSFNSSIKWYLEGFNRILCVSKAKSLIVAVKLVNFDETAQVGFGKHKELGIIDIKNLKINYLPINPNVSLIKCYIMNINNDNLLYILYETHISLYNVEKLTYLFDTNILWRVQGAYLNKSLHFFDNEKFFCLSNDERLMIRKHVTQVTVWNELPNVTTGSTNKTKNIPGSGVNSTNAAANFVGGSLASTKQIHNYLTDTKHTWEIRVGKFLSKNPNRRNIVCLQAVVNLNSDLIDLINKNVVKTDEEGGLSKQISIEGQNEILVSISREGDNQSEMNFWYLWREGLRLLKTIPLDSYLNVTNDYDSVCCLKYEESKLILGLMDGCVHIYNLNECKLENKFLLNSLIQKNDSTETKAESITRLKLVGADFLVASTDLNQIYFLSIKSSKLLYLLNIPKFIDTIYAKITSNLKFSWQINNTGRYIVIADSSGFIHIGVATILSSDDLKYEKHSSLQVSVEPINELIFIENNQKVEETNLAIFSNDYLLNYVDLSLLNRQMKNLKKSFSIEEEDSLFESAFSNIIFGQQKLLLSYTDSDSLVIDYDRFFNEAAGQPDDTKQLESSSDITIGVFIKNDEAFIGTSASLQVFAVELYAWDTKSGKRLAKLVDVKNEANDECIKSVTCNDTFLAIVTNKRQLLMNVSGNQLVVLSEILFQNTNIPKGMQFNDAIYTYFTKNSSFLIYETISVEEKNDLKIVPSKTFNLTAFSVDEKLFTSYCFDGTNKSSKTGRYEPLKVKFRSICSVDAEILCIFKGNLLIWKPFTEKSFEREQQKQQAQNAKTSKLARVIKKDEISAQYNGNMALLSSIPYFVTFLKHSLRLYDDLPGIPDLIKSEITACAATSNGDIICTGDQFGYLIFWYRRESLNKKFVKVTTFENLDYSYWMQKVHATQINILKVCDKDEYLISSSLDRSIKIWNIQTATYLCSIYTHLIINKIYFNTEKCLLIAIASRLGVDKMLAFELINQNQPSKNRQKQMLSARKLSKRISINDELLSHSNDIINFFNVT